MQSNEYLEDVVSLSLKEERCIGCLMCTMVCPHGVFEMVSGPGENDLSGPLHGMWGVWNQLPGYKAIKVTSGDGCAQAVFNSLTGRNGKGCCCTLEDPTISRERENSP